MKNDSMRLLIVGGVAAGASAAARARRLSETADITIIERGADVSFANCGLPYHIGGEIADRSRLALQTPQSLSALLNITVRNNTEAVRIEREQKVLVVRGTKGGQEESIPYDKLILAPGASPLRPPLPGIDSPRIHTLRNLQDMDAIKAAAANSASVLVVGAGFIGLEMAEQLAHLGKQVTLVEAAEHVLPQMDKEMVAPVEAELRARGITLITGDALAGFAETQAGICAQLKSGHTVTADFAILSIGVRAESKLAVQAGLAQGARGTIAVNHWMQTSDPDIYAAGDAVELTDRITGQPMHLPLGGPANRQGRLIADHIFTPSLARPYPGHLGTAIVRVFDRVAGLTGWTEQRLTAAKIPHEVSLVTDFQHASYFPGALPLTIKLLWEPHSGRLLGAQAHGIDGVDKRLDVLATALAGGLTVDDLADLELAYAPPFGSARDVVNVAGFAAQNQRRGLLQAVATLPAGRRVLDVRPAASAQLNPIPDALNIPLEALRARLGEIDKSAQWVTVCAVGKSSYFAARILAQNGIDAISLSGGWAIRRPAVQSAAVPLATGGLSPAPDTAGAGAAGGATTGVLAGGGAGAEGNVAAGATAEGSTAAGATDKGAQVERSEVVRLDCSGMSCPGPLMRVKTGMDELQAHQVLEVIATDPGFAKDVAAFCRACDHELLSVEQARGVVTAKVARKSVGGASVQTTEGAHGSTGFAQTATAAQGSAGFAQATAGAAVAALPPSAALAAGGASAAGLAPRRKGATIVVFSGELDKVMAALVIGNGATMLGGEVTLFFTFWGINALRKEQAVPVKGKKLLDRMFGWMLPRGLGKLPLSKMHFGGMGSRLMKHQMASKNLPNLPGLLGSAKLAGVRLVVCTMAMEAMGIREEELLDGVELGGVADYLESAERTGTNLFV